LRLSFAFKFLSTIPGPIYRTLQATLDPIEPYCRHGEERLKLRLVRVEMGLGPENLLEVSSLKSGSTQKPAPAGGTGQILALAKGDPAKFTSFFTRVRQAYPEKVKQLTLRQIAFQPESAAAREMAAWLAAASAYMALLFDPAFLPLEEARRAIAVMRAADAKFAVKLTRAMQETTGADCLVRALTLIEDIEDYSAFYPRLCTLTWHSDNYIRSKAVLALCRVRPNRSLIDRQLEWPDARVRANAIEAVAGLLLRDPEALPPPVGPAA